MTIIELQKKEKKLSELRKKNERKRIQNTQEERESDGETGEELATFEPEDKESSLYKETFNNTFVEGNQEALYHHNAFNVTPNINSRDTLGNEKVSTVTPMSNEQGILKLSLDNEDNQMSLGNTDTLLETEKRRVKTVTVENDPNQNEEISTVTARSLETRLETYTREQLLQYIIRIKKTKENELLDVEEINELTLTQVITCAKFELFKRIQFIRHPSLLKDFEKKGSIGRFVMRKLKIKKERRKIFWNTYFNTVRKTVKSQRNIIHTNLRRKFLGK